MLLDDWRDRDEDGEVICSYCELPTDSSDGICNDCYDVLYNDSNDPDY